MNSFDAQIQLFSGQIEEELRRGHLNFPTAFDVSMRIKRLADDLGSRVEDIAGLVRAEPVLSAKVIRMANTAMLNPHGAQVTSVTEAVRRIGLSSLRCLAFSVAAEQIAQDHRSRNMRLIASGLWMHSVDVASWSHALARHLGTVNPDTAMLAGMLASIGQFFLLARASAYPALEENLNSFAGFVSIWSEPAGRAVLETFELPDSVLDAFQYENPYGGSWPPANLADTVLIAGFAAETPNPFDALLDPGRKTDLFGSCAASIDKTSFDSLLEAARASKQKILAAVCS